jgi:hypothetical protein
MKWNLGTNRANIMEIITLGVLQIFSLRISWLILYFTGLSQAPYSFTEELNSDNLHSQLSQEELNEIAADSNANNPQNDTSHSSSDSDRDDSEAARENEDFFSKENASSGLTVSFDYYVIFCTKFLFSLLVIGLNFPLTNEKPQQKGYATIIPIALRQYPPRTLVMLTYVLLFSPCI